MYLFDAAPKEINPIATVIIAVITLIILIFISVVVFFKIFEVQIYNCFCN